MDKTTPSPSPVPSIHSPPDGVSASRTVGIKRKRGNGVKYYAVKAGFEPGIYYEWKECQAQITGYKGALFKAFPTLEEANVFLSGGTVAAGSGGRAGSNETRYYGIQRGLVPGVYTDWAKAQEQIRGFKGPRYKKFFTREEAEAFVKEGRNQNSSLVDTVAREPARFGAPGLELENPKDENGNERQPGTGLLPPAAQDGFDPNLLLDPTTGKVVYKTTAEKTATKTKSKDGPSMLRIYTDGSSLKNGLQGALAGIGVYFGPGDKKNVSEPLKGNRQTNQRAELTAILRAIDIAPRHRDVTIVTDSQYSIKCVTEWFVSWRRRNWTTSENKSVENRDLIESILARIEERNQLNVKTLFEWVKGHDADPGNIAADRLAQNGARKGAAGRFAALEVMLDLPNDAFSDQEEV